VSCIDAAEQIEQHGSGHGSSPAESGQQGAPGKREKRMGKWKMGADRSEKGEDRLPRLVCCNIFLKLCDKYKYTDIYIRTLGEITSIILNKILYIISTYLRYN